MSCCFYYCPQTKLLQGNVFTGVSLSTGGGGLSLVPCPFWEWEWVSLVPFLGCRYLWYQVPFKAVGMSRGGGYVSDGYSRGLVCLGVGMPRVWICLEVGTIP